MTTYRTLILALALAAGALPAAAQKTPGVSDTEIILGQTQPYSGPASAYGVIGKTEVAYMQKINDEGGVNGRKIRLISLDDGYTPPRALEQIRKLVEEEGVLAIFQSLGTPSNSAIRPYLNKQKVPHLFLATGATKWADPEHFPWTIGWNPNYQLEAHIYAKYILGNMPDAKIAVLYQNDDYGKDYLKGLHDGLGDKAAKMIVAEASYEVTDPTVDSQVATLQASGANVFVNITTPKFAAQAIRHAYDIGWRPTQFLNNVSRSVGAVLKPAGLDKSVGLITADYLKDQTDPAAAKDPDVVEWRAFMQKYYPDADMTDVFPVYGYVVAHAMVQVLKQCGNDLSRENVMRQAANLDMSIPMLANGIKVKTGPKDFSPLKTLRLYRFDGEHWVSFSDLIEG